MVVENRHRRALEIREAVINDVRQYIGAMKVFDDITLVVIKQKYSSKPRSDSAVEIGVVQGGAPISTAPSGHCCYCRNFRPVKAETER